jgi:hypothetical protein
MCCSFNTVALRFDKHSTLAKSGLAVDSTGKGPKISVLGEGLFGHLKYIDKNGKENEARVTDSKGNPLPKDEVDGLILDLTLTPSAKSDC